MHRELYRHADEHDVDSLVAAAQRIGLDAARFRRELVERAHAPRVKELAVRAIRHGVVGVPTLFINGERYAESPRVEPLAAAVRAQLEG